jgi:hypothetical protein
VTAATDMRRRSRLPDPEPQDEAYKAACEYAETSLDPMAIMLREAWARLRAGDVTGASVSLQGAMLANGHLAREAEIRAHLAANPHLDPCSSAAPSAFAMTIRVNEAGTEVSLDHPLGRDAWVKARTAMEAARAEMERLLSLQRNCPARPEEVDSPEEIHNVTDNHRGWVGSWLAEPLAIAKLTSGAKVIFRGCDAAEVGIVTSWNDQRVWARFHQGDTAASCDPGDLMFAVMPLDGPALSVPVGGEKG